MDKPNTVADVLRHVADNVLWHSKYAGYPGAWSLCISLDLCVDRRVITREARQATLDYLVWLGMPVNVVAFPEEPAKTDYRQSLRWAWCHFAADLWDEGVRP